MKHLQENAGAVQLSRRLQLSLIILVAAAWLAGTLWPIAMALRNANDAASGYMWYSLGAQFFIPLVYAAIGLVYATQHYRGRLHQTFVAVYLATLGMLMYMTAQGLYNMYRYGIAEPREYFHQPTFWEQVGGDAILTVGCLLLYTVLVWHHDWRLHRAK
jgi:hypothetical protein